MSNKRQLKCKMGRKAGKLYKTLEELYAGYFPKGKREESGQAAKLPVKLRAKRTKKGLSLYLDYYRNGRRQYEFLGLYLNKETNAQIREINRETLTTATLLLDERNTDIIRGVAGLKPARKGKLSLFSYIKHLAEDGEKRTGNKHSVNESLNALAKHLKTYAGNETRVDNVDERFTRGFIKYLATAKSLKGRTTGRGTILKQNTRHKLISVFGYVVKQAVRAGMLDGNPLSRLEAWEVPGAVSGKREFLTVEEVKGLIETPCTHEILKRAFLFCCLTGLRYSDIKRITWGELERDNTGAVMLRFRMKKVKRGVNLYLSDEALKWLPERDGAKTGDFIFPLMCNSTENKCLKEWVEAAGIDKHITFHCARHTAATLNLSLGVPIETVSRMLGHSRIQTTQIYAKVMDESIKKAVNKQNGLFE